MIAHRQALAFLLLLSSGLSFAGPREILIPTTAPTDQKDTLQCWAVSAVARFDALASHAKGSFVKLSPKYTVYTKTRAEVIGMILSKSAKKYQGALCEGCPDEDIYYEQGGILPDAVEAAKLFGVLPYEAYSGFPQNDEKMFRALNALIGAYAENPERYDKPRVRLEAEVTARVEAILAKALGGRPPEDFDFEGTHYTPLTFLVAVLPGFEHARGRELNFEKEAPREPSLTHPVAFDGRKYEAFATSDRALLLKTLKKALLRGEPVLLQYTVIDEEKTQTHGYIGFKINGQKPRAPDNNALEHYVLAVGAHFNKDGSFAEIYVKNTWDTQPGPRWGYQWMQPDYFYLISGVELPDS